MFLLVSVRHVGAHPDEHQHGVSIIWVKHSSTSSDISYTKYSSDLNLGEGLSIFTSFHFADSGLYLLNGFDFYFHLFWMAWHWKPLKTFQTAQRIILSFNRTILVSLGKFQRRFLKMVKLHKYLSIKWNGTDSNFVPRFSGKRNDHS